jgi:Uma2 family endonuclease
MMPSDGVLVTTTAHATVDDLYAVPGKAELVGGRIVEMPPTGFMPSYAGLIIATSLLAHQRSFGGGVAVGDGAGFRVNMQHRESFSPDAAWYTGPRTGMKFFEGAPAFAAEIRSEGDYGPAAEAAMHQKRADYFAAGTLVVWDVDLLADDVVRAYHADDPDHPQIYRRGQLADAQPAVPGWRLAVDELFE